MTAQRMLHFPEGKLHYYSLLVEAGHVIITGKLSRFPEVYFRIVPDIQAAAFALYLGIATYKGSC